MTRRPRKTRSSGGIGASARARREMLFDIGNHQWRQMKVCDRRAAAMIGGRHRNCLIERVGRLPAETDRHIRLLPSRREYAAHVLPRRLAPVLYVERMCSIVRVPAAIHVYVGRVARKYL